MLAQFSRIQSLAIHSLCWLTKYTCLISFLFLFFFLLQIDETMNKCVLVFKIDLHIKQFILYMYLWLCLKLVYLLIYLFFSVDILLSWSNKQFIVIHDIFFWLRYFGLMILYFFQTFSFNLVFFFLFSTSHQFVHIEIVSLVRLITVTTKHIFSVFRICCENIQIFLIFSGVFERIKNHGWREQ